MRPFDPVVEDSIVETLNFRRDRLVIGGGRASNFPPPISQVVRSTVQIKQRYCFPIHSVALTDMDTNYKRQGPSQQEGVHPKKYQITGQNTIHPQICVVCNKYMMRGSSQGKTPCHHNL